MQHMEIRNNVVGDFEMGVERSDPYKTVLHYLQKCFIFCYCESWEQWNVLEIVIRVCQNLTGELDWFYFNIKIQCFLYYEWKADKLWFILLLFGELTMIGLFNVDGDGWTLEESLLLEAYGTVTQFHSHFKEYYLMKSYFDLLPFCLESLAMHHRLLVFIDPQMEER